jgi:hypothetical protein
VKTWIRAFAAAMVVFAISWAGVAAQGPRPTTPPPSNEGFQIVQPQPPPQPTPPPTDFALIPLRLQVTLSRYQNDKRTSSVPFTLLLNANERQNTTLTTGLQVPIATGPTASNVGVVGYQYQNVGTNITANATRTPEGRFTVLLNVEDSSVLPARDGRGAGEPPTMASLRSNTRLLLRDGQTAEFVAATDRVSGEVTKIEVSLNVLK